MNPTPKFHPAVAALITIVLVGIATGVVVVASDQAKTATPSSSISSGTVTSDTPSSNSGTSSTNNAGPGDTYKDGKYTATTTYRAPGGLEQITVSVVVANNTISTVDIDQQGDSRESQDYQSMFASSYQPRVVGKKLNEVSLSRVAGASLTSSGFNDALEQIKHDAAA